MGRCLSITAFSIKGEWKNQGRCKSYEKKQYFARFSILFSSHTLMANAASEKSKQLLTFLTTMCLTANNFTQLAAKHFVDILAEFPPLQVQESLNITHSECVCVCVSVFTFPREISLQSSLKNAAATCYDLVLRAVNFPQLALLLTQLCGTT